MKVFREKKFLSMFFITPPLEPSKRNLAISLKFFQFCYQKSQILIFFGKMEFFFGPLNVIT
jgi:hypothetical protein